MIALKELVTMVVLVWTRLEDMNADADQDMLDLVVKVMSMNAYQTHVFHKVHKNVFSLSIITTVYANLDGWEDTVRQRGTSASIVHARMAEFAAIMKKDMSVCAELDIVEQIVSS